MVQEPIVLEIQDHATAHMAERLYQPVHLQLFL